MRSLPFDALALNRFALRLYLFANVRVECVALEQANAHAQGLRPRWIARVCIALSMSSAIFSTSSGGFLLVHQTAGRSASRLAAQPLPSSARRETSPRALWKST